MSRSDFSFCFVPGWAENRWKSHLLFDRLTDAGGHFVDDVKTADVVITHSAGGHFTSDNMALKLLVVIGPIYGTGRPLIIRTAQSWASDSIFYLGHGLFKPWLLKNIYYIYYAIFHPLKTIRTYLAIHTPLELAFLAKYKVLLIRNRIDYFCLPEIEQAAKRFKNITYAPLPGIHDDLWVNPEPYVDLILKHL